MAKALYVIHHSEFGGPHNTALRLHAPLQENGWELTVLLPNEQGNAARRLREANVPVIQLPLHRLRASLDPRLAMSAAVSFPREVLRIQRTLMAGEFDLVALAGLINPHAAVAGRLAHVAVLWTLIDTRTPAPLVGPLMSVVRRTGDAVMITGSGLISVHSGRKGVGLPHFIFYPPVDTRTFAPSPERRHATRQRLGIPDDALVVGTVANLNRQKGLETFIGAAALIQRDIPGSWFLLVGAIHPSQRRYAARLIEQLRQSSISHFLMIDAQPDLENYYAAMDLKVISSVRLSEGVPTTAIEAQSCGLPVVTTRVGAVAEVVQDGVTGVIVDGHDPAFLASAVCRLLRQPELRAKFGAAARSRALDNYDVAICARAHVDAFNETLRLSRRRRGGLATRTSESSGEGSASVTVGNRED
jgi:glycosyltransferase involved in cell wall biosynthesis